MGRIKLPHWSWRVLEMIGLAATAIMIVAAVVYLIHIYLMYHH